LNGGKQKHTPEVTWRVVDAQMKEDVPKIPTGILGSATESQRNYRFFLEIRFTPYELCDGSHEWRV
jgi:hypothetical protein